MCARSWPCLKQGGSRNDSFLPQLQQGLTRSRIISMLRPITWRMSIQLVTRTRINFLRLDLSDHGAWFLDDSTNRVTNGYSVGIWCSNGTQKEFVGSLKATSIRPMSPLTGTGSSNQMPNGTIGYTRDGAFHVDKNGNLVTPEGYRLEPNIVVPNEAIAIHIGGDGRSQQRSQLNLMQHNSGRFRRQLRQSCWFTQYWWQPHAGDQCSGPAVIGTPGENGLVSCRRAFSSCQTHCC